MSTTDEALSQAEDKQAKRDADDPRFKQARAVSGGDKGREMLEHAAQGATLDSNEEHSALDWLLGTPQRAVFDVPVTVNTENGEQEMTFTIQAQDGKVIERIENANRKADGSLDSIKSSASIVGEATESMRDPSGREMSPRDPKFLTMQIVDATGRAGEHTFADPSEALLRRFTGQHGVLVFLANEIRRVSGFDPSLVGQGKRRLAKAALD